MEGLGPPETGHAQACDSSTAYREGDEEGERRSSCSSISLSHGALLYDFAPSQSYKVRHIMFFNHFQYASMNAGMDHNDEVLLACRCYVSS